jgi:hypothetical protein
MSVVNDRPNAAVIRVYELTSRANFDRASRAALWHDNSAALGGELVMAATTHARRSRRNRSHDESAAIRFRPSR